LTSVTTIAEILDEIGSMLGYLKSQTYPEPHPRELMLRNHV
jgi:hypothetical protein